MLAGIDTLRNNTMMAAVMRGYHATLGDWSTFNPGFPSGGEPDSGAYGSSYPAPSTPASQPGTNWAQIIPAIGQAVGQSIAIARGQPVYGQNPALLRTPTQASSDTITNAANTGAGITAQLGNFIKNNSGIVLAGGIALLLFKSGRK
jgi:hypothetical protein